jgi:hypothetical protein
MKGKMMKKLMKVVVALYNFTHSSQLLERIVQLLHGPIYTDQIYPFTIKRTTAALFLLSGLDEATVWGYEKVGVGGFLIIHLE